MAGQDGLGRGKVAVAEVRFAKGALPEAAFIPAGVLPGQDHRQGDFLVDEVIAGILAHLRCRGAVIQRVIHDLKGHAKCHAVTVERLNMGDRRTGDLDPGGSGGGEQHRCLAADHIQIIGQRRVRLAGDRHLQDLALGDPGGGGGKPPQHRHIARLDHQLEGPCEQKIPDQNRSVVPPQRVGRILAAAEL